MAASYKYVKKLLGFGGEGQPPAPTIDPDRTGLHIPPTQRELLHYALHLADTSTPTQKDLLK